MYRLQWIQLLYYHFRLLLVIANCDIRFQGLGVVIPTARFRNQASCLMVIQIVPIAEA